MGKSIQLKDGNELLYPVTRPIIEHSFGGTAVPLVTGGTSINLNEIHVRKFGNLVCVNVLTWGSAVVGGNSEILRIRLPYKAITERNRGITGYNDTNTCIIPAIDVGTPYLCFTSKSSLSSNEGAYTGLNMPNGTWQCQIWYLTND